MPRSSFTSVLTLDKRAYIKIISAGVTEMKCDAAVAVAPTRSQRPTLMYNNSSY